METSATISAERSRSVARLVPLREPSRNPASVALAATFSAGSAPNSSPVASVTVTEPTSRRASTPGDSGIGSVVGTRRATSGTASTAADDPSTPPRPAMTMFSVSICRTRRSRPAPSAVRTASSRCLPRARDSSRPARLVQAMSSMQNAAPASAHSIWRERQETSSRSVTTAMPFRSFAAG